MQQRFQLLQAEFGSLYRLAKVLKITPNAVYNWQIRDTVPLKYIRVIETLTDGRITRQQLRPDIFEA